MNTLKTLPISRYQLRFRVTKSISLPEYEGSALRGIFGRTLKKISCMTKLENCKTCSLYRTCPYTNIFETPPPQNHHLQKFSQVPNGYIIEPLGEWGVKTYHPNDMFCFDLVLFGKLISHLTLIAFAFKCALEYNLAGGKGELIDILHYDEWENKVSILKNKIILEYNENISIDKSFPQDLNLFFSTPLRIQENGNPLREDRITLPRLLISLAKRISLLSEFHSQPLHLNFEKLISQIEKIKDKKNLKWQDWTRYSTRQKQEMKLGGVIGEWRLENVPMEWAKLLYIGQWLHCGKNTTFGLGKYKITNL